MKSIVRFVGALLGMLLLAACGLSPGSTAAPVAVTDAAPQPEVETAPAVSGDTPAGAPIKEQVTYESDGLKMTGYVFRPATGDGPFPAVVWNHGSEPTPGAGHEFDDVAAIFVPAGYVVMAPERRGHDTSEGDYIVDVTKKEATTNGKGAASQLLVKLMETEQLDDQLAGLAYVETLPYVDKNRIGVIGCSYGGIQTMLAAERGADYKAAVAISPGAQSWNGNVPLQDRLKQAAANAKIPVLLIHPAKDASTDPGYALAQEFIKAGKPYGLYVYPPIGTEESQQHCFGGRDTVWKDVVLQYMDNYLK
jgi:dienelactone hydrolase